MKKFKRPFLTKKTVVLVNSILTCFLLLSLFAQQILAQTPTSEPKTAPTTEARALWVTRWDYSSPDDIKTIVQNARSHHFNMLLFQVRGNGTVLYPSQYEPLATELDWPDTSWNPLQLAIDEAHAAGLQLHAWVNVYPGWRGQTPPENPAQLWNRRHFWFMVDESDRRQELNSHYVWLAPTIPQVRDYLYQVFVELIKNYDLDGLHFDYIRYPGPGYSYDPLSLNAFFQVYHESPANLPYQWDKWRRDSITRLVEKSYHKVQELKPHLILSAAVTRNYDMGKNIFLQESHLWLARGIMDIIFPMIYTPNTMLFQRMAQAHLSNAHYRFVLPGIFVSEPLAMLTQIETARELGSPGHCLFSYKRVFPNHQPGQIANLLKSGPYRVPARIPEMPWKTSGSGDTVGPLIAQIETVPPEVRVGQRFHVQCTITDESGIYEVDPDQNDKDGVHLLWSNNGNLDYGHKIPMVKQPDSSTFRTITPIPAQSLGTNFIFRILAWDTCSSGEKERKNNPGCSEIETVLIREEKALYVQEGTFGPLVFGPQFIEVDSRDRIWVCGAGENSLRVLNPDGTEAPFSPITHGLNSQGDSVRMLSPSGIAIDNYGIVYVSGHPRGNIFKFSSLDGEALLGFETYFSPAELDFDEQNHLFIIEPGGNRWHILDEDGNELDGSPVNGGHINQGIAVSNDGHSVYITCQAEGVVHCWHGQIRDRKASYSPARALPVSDVSIGTVDVDRKDCIYVSHTSLGQVTILNREQEIIGYLVGGSPPLRAPRGVGFNQQASILYVVEVGAASPVRLQKWVRKD